MKIAALFVTLVASAQAFAPAAFTRGTAVVSKTQRFADPEEEEGLDLNLEEMFDM